MKQYDKEISKARYEVWDRMVRKAKSVTGSFVALKAESHWL